MIHAVGVIELKSIAKGVEATDAALKSAGISLITAHPTCPGKYEILFTGSISDVTAALEHVKGRFEQYIVDSSVMGRIDERVISALFGTQSGVKKGALGAIETYSGSSGIKVADIAVKTSRVEIYDLRISRGMGGKGIVLIVGDVGDVTAAVEAGARHAKDQSMLAYTAVIAAPHKELWDQI